MPVNVRGRAALIETKVKPSAQITTSSSIMKAKKTGMTFQPSAMTKISKLPGKPTIAKKASTVENSVKPAAISRAQSVNSENVIVADNAAQVVPLTDAIATTALVSSIKLAIPAEIPTEIHSDATTEKESPPWGPDPDVFDLVAAAKPFPAVVATARTISAALPNAIRKASATTSLSTGSPLHNDVRLLDEGETCGYTQHKADGDLAEVVKSAAHGEFMPRRTFSNVSTAVQSPVLADLQKYLSPKGSASNSQMMLFKGMVENLWEMYVDGDAFVRSHLFGGVKDITSSVY
jgi:hypothetical protein